MYEVINTEITCYGQLIMKLNNNTSWQELSREVEKVRIIEENKKLGKLFRYLKLSCLMPSSMIAQFSFWKTQACNSNPSLMTKKLH